MDKQIFRLYIFKYLRFIVFNILSRRIIDKRYVRDIVEKSKKQLAVVRIERTAPRLFPQRF